jgi:HSP20 family molecular chaperone IbpA
METQKEGKSDKKETQKEGKSDKKDTQKEGKSDKKETQKEGKSDSNASSKETSSINVSISKKVHSLSEQMRMPSQRQTINARFKLENGLRDLVLSLSDNFEKLEKQWIDQIIGKVEAVDPRISKYLIRPSGASLPLNIFNPAEQWALQEIIRMPQESNHRMTHEELFEYILCTQGNESEREKFLKSVILVIQSLIPNYPANSKILTNLQSELIEIMKNLYSDETFTWRNNLIKHARDSIEQIKNVWNYNQHIVNSTFPLIDHISYPEEVLIHAYINRYEGVDDFVVEVSKDGSNMRLSAKDSSFSKYFVLPEKVVPESYDAGYSDGILRIKFKKAI